MLPEPSPTPVSSFQRILLWIEDDRRLSQICAKDTIRGVATIVGITLLVGVLGFWHFRSGETRRNSIQALQSARFAQTELACAESSHRRFSTSRSIKDVQDLATHRLELQHQLQALLPALKNEAQATATVNDLLAKSELLRDAAQFPGVSLRDSPASEGASTAAGFPNRSALDEMSAALAGLVKVCDARMERLESSRNVQLALLGLGVLLSSGFAIGILVVAQRRNIRAMVSRPTKELEAQIKDAETTIEWAKAREIRTEAAWAQSDAILAGAREGAIIFDQEMHIRWINPAAENLFGHQPGKAVGQNLNLLIPQLPPLTERTSLPRTLTTVGQRTGYFSFPIEITLSEFTRDGARHFCALVRDDTERQRHEFTLACMALGMAPAAPEEFTRQLLKYLTKALGTQRAFLLEVIGEGHKAVAMLTIAEGGELCGTTAVDLPKTACMEVLSRGFCLVSEGIQEQFPEDTMLAMTGAKSFAGAPLSDYRGRATGVLGVLDDKAFTDEALTERVLDIFAPRAAADLERKRFEEALAMEKEHLAVTLRSIGDGCMTLDNDGRIVMLNFAAERLTGWGQKEAVGRLVHDVLHLVDEQTGRRCQRLVERVIQDIHGEFDPELKTVHARDGEERRVDSSSAPIRDPSGRKLGAIIVLRDVTDRLRMEEERQKTEKLESLGLVAGGIAHDFNNLLTTILGNVTLALGASDISAVVTERLTAARKGANRARELAGQLLTFAKGGNPVMQLLDLTQLFTDTVQCAVAGSPIECEVQLPEGLWPVEADPGQIATVIANIAVNGVQAMPTAGTLRVSAENLELPIPSASLGLREGRWVRLVIHDQGVGIPEQFLKKIFDPYFTTKPSNSGLGLASAYSIVKNHGGVILVESTPGEGSTFSVYLPASSKELQPVADVIETPVPTGTGRVLVLDDEEAICMLVTCALEPLGYEVTETQDGTVALAKYEEAMKEGRRYDLVISDLTMPGRMSGHEAIRLLRELDPTVKAIVSSGYANDPVMSRHEDYGFCGMIAKPYEIDALGRKVSEIMAQVSAPRVIYHSFEERKTA